MDGKLTLYETPEGVISTSSRGRQEIVIYRSKPENLICVKIISRRPRDTREFYQIIGLDADMARHLGAILLEASKSDGQ